MKKLLPKAIGAFINSTATLFPKWSTTFTFNLLCKVRSAGISEKGKAFFAQGTQHFFEVEGHSAVLHKWGAGAKHILFLHGWESNSQRWLPYYNRVKKENYTVYALDAPGHGMAKGKIMNVELYRQAIAHTLQQIKEVDTVICHSLSNTAMSYQYLLTPNMAIKKFVVMGASSQLDDSLVYFQNILGISERALNNLRAKANTILKIPYQEITLRRFFENVKQPVLVIHDKGDKITPYPPIAKAIAVNPKLETFITTGLKHDLKGAEVYEKVIAFIEK